VALFISMKDATTRISNSNCLSNGGRSVFKVVSIDERGFIEKTFSRVASGPPGRGVRKIVKLSERVKSEQEIWDDKISDDPPDIYATFTFKWSVNWEKSKDHIHKCLFVWSRKHLGLNTHVEYMGRGDYQTKREEFFTNNNPDMFGVVDCAYHQLQHPEKFVHFHVAIWIRGESPNTNTLECLSRKLKYLWNRQGYSYIVPWKSDLTSKCLSYMFGHHDESIEGRVCKGTGICKRKKTCQYHNH